MSNYTPTWKAWLEKAAKELRTAKVLLDISKNEHLETVLFLCQQAVEKSIKGYLSKNNVRFDKTHDIQKLLKNVSTINSELATMLEPSVILSKYAVALRYPEETSESLSVDRALAENAYKTAKSGHEAILSERSSMEEH